MQRKFFIFTILLFIVDIIDGMGQSRNGNQYGMDGGGASFQFGLVTGMNAISIPESMQNDYDKSNYYDFSGGLMLGCHKRVTDGFDFDWNLSVMGSTVANTVREDDQKKMKFLFPNDFRFFIGGKYFKGYLQTGIQYNFVFSWIPGDGSYYSDYWGNVWHEGDYAETSTAAHQFSSNLGYGLLATIPIDEYEGSMFAMMLGTKLHIPIANPAEAAVQRNGKVIEFGKDKTCLVMNASLAISPTSAYSLKLDYELPLGGGKSASEDDGAVIRYFKQKSQALYFSLIFNM